MERLPENTSERGAVSNDKVKNAASPPRRLGCLLYVFTPIVLVIIGWLVTLQRDAEQLRPAPAKITIGPNTTFIEGPLDETGVVDYVAALNEHYSRGVTEQNNAGRDLLTILDPRIIHSSIRAEYFERLQLPMSENADFFQSSRDFSIEFPHSRETSEEKDSTKQPSLDFTDELDKANVPFTSKQFPRVAAWVKVNNFHIDVLVAASRKERLYLPLIALQNKPVLAAPRLMHLLLPVQQEMRELTLCLCHRALLRAGNQDIDGALDDVLAVHRLARLLAQGATVIELLIAYAMEYRAHQVDRALIYKAGCSSEQLARLQNELLNMPPLPGVATKVDAERFAILDVAVTSSQLGLDTIFTFSHRHSEVSNSLRNMVNQLGSNAIDWDEVLFQINLWYNEVDKIVQMPNTHARLQELSKLSERIRVKRRDRGDLMVATIRSEWWRTGSLTLAVSRACADVMIILLTPAYEQIVLAESRMRDMGKITQLGFELARYHRDHGAYPEQLVNLCPGYMPSLPLDEFGCAFRYQRAPMGFLLHVHTIQFHQNQPATRDEALVLRVEHLTPMP